jgi:hypothetical protein
MAIIKLDLNLIDPNGLVPMVTDYAETFAANANITGWWEARLPEIDKDGSNLVGTLYDKSGNGADWLQADSAKKPEYVANVLNGKGVLRYDGNVKLMEGGPSIPISADFTKVMLVKPAGTGIRGLWGSNATEQHILQFNANNNVTAQVGSTNTASEIYTALDDPLDTWHFIVQSFDDSAEEVKISVNGGAVESTVQAGAETTNGVSFLGSNLASGANDFVGDIAMAMALDIDLLDAGNSALLDTVNAYVGDTFGLNIS